MFKRVPFLLSLVPLLAVVAVALIVAAAAGLSPQPTSVVSAAGPVGPPGAVTGPVEVSGVRELHRTRVFVNVREETVYRIHYSVGGVQFDAVNTDYAQWFEIEWNTHNGTHDWKPLGSGESSGFASRSAVSKRGEPRAFGYRDSVWVRIRGANQAGGGPWTTPQEVHFTPFISGSRASVDGTTATLYWSVRPNSDVTPTKVRVHKVEYTDKRDNYGQDDYARPWGQPWTDVNVNATSHKFEGLEFGKTYILRVQACVGENGGNCGYAVRTYATIRFPENDPGPLVNPKIYINTCTERFYWDITPPAETADHGKAKRYEFEYRQDGTDDWIAVHDTAARRSEYTVVAAHGQNWKFHIRVRAVNDHGNGPWSLSTTEANRQFPEDDPCSATGPTVAISPDSPGNDGDDNGGDGYSEDDNLWNSGSGHNGGGHGNSGQNDGGNGNGGNTIQAQNAQPAQQNEGGETENSDAQTGDTDQPAQTENSDIQTEQGGQPEQTENTDAQTEQPGQPQAQESNSQPDNTGDTGNTGDTVTTALEEQPEEDAQTRRVVRRYDVNNNGRVDLDEVLTAIGDYYLTDSLALEDLLALLRQYRAA